MTPKIFIDGSEGTTGLRLREFLSGREDISLLEIDPALRKDVSARKTLLNEADLVFLCLPDSASREAVSLIQNPDTRVIDASTAFRTDPDWVYGFPELCPAQREKIRASKRVAVPGCHATGFVSLAAPLVQQGIAGHGYPFSCTSLSGYSGGGKKLIAAYEQGGDKRLTSPRLYSLALHHKHLPEMQTVCGLTFPPLFSPAVDDYFEGLLVSVPLHRRLLQKPMSGPELCEVFSEFYACSSCVLVAPFGGDTFTENGYLDALQCNGTNTLELFVFGSEDNILLVSRLDNLGKGAAGAAVQCMNLMLGFEETEGLVLSNT